MQHVNTVTEVFLGLGGQWGI